MIINGFDTETTGLPNFRLPANHASQPRIVQIAAKLVEDKGNGEFEELQKFSVLVKPEGFVIPDEVSKIHGITTEHALKFGVPLVLAMSMFSNFVKAADRNIAHNIRFDAQMIDRELQLLKKPNRLAQKEQFCTMTAATGLCKLPATARMRDSGMGGKYKSPKLIEAHEFFLGVGFDKAHDALADVEAMFRIYPYVTGQKTRAAA